MKYQKNDRYKKIIMSFPTNVPSRLISAYKKIVKQNKDKGGYQRKLARQLGINDFYLNQLLTKGIEPTNQDIRVRLFLKPITICKTCGHKIRMSTTNKKKEQPAYMREWKKLPATERQRAIEVYISWRKK